MFHILNRTIAIYTLLLPLLLIYATPEKAKAADPRASVFKFDHLVTLGYYSTKSNYFFISEGNLYILLRKEKDPYTKEWNSLIASTPLGENRWSNIEIPGQVFFLGPACNDEICSIVQKKNRKWEIKFYNLKGNLLRTVEHTWQKQKFEEDRFIPTPITFSDGSIIFYSEYRYGARHPIINSLIAFITLGGGGHAWKTATGSGIEIVPALVKNDRKAFRYAEIIDASWNKTVFAVHEESFDKSKLFRMVDTVAGKYKIVKYELLDRSSTFYRQDNLLIKIPMRKPSEMFDVTNNQILAQLPPFPKGEYLETRWSPVAFDSRNDIYFLIEGSPSSGLLYLFFYDQDKSVWKTNALNIEKINSDLRMFLWGENIYLGVESFYDHAFIVIECNIADLKEGVTINTKD